MRVLFWTATALLAWTQALYAPALALLRRLRGAPPPAPAGDPADQAQTVSLIVAAYREEAVIAAKVANALALDWPRDRLELIVAVDGGGDATAERARAAGADRVLELPRGGKIRAQDAAVRAASGDLLAFSDANALLGARTRCATLVAPFADPARRLRLRAGRVHQRGRRPTRRASTGATSCGCARRSRRWPR